MVLFSSISACPVCYLDQKQAIGLMPDAPSFSPVHNLTYVYEEVSSKTEFGGSEFGGYPSLKQRDDSYDIRESMNVHCGYIIFFPFWFTLLPKCLCGPLCLTYMYTKK